MAAHAASGGLRIGQVAELLGMSVRTIRYYEDCGLLPPPRRHEGGFRVYLRGDVERLRQIQRLTQALRYSLDDVRALIDHEDELRRKLAPGSALDHHCTTLAQLELSLRRQYLESTRRLEWLTALRAQLAALITELKENSLALEQTMPPTRDAAETRRR